MLISTIFLILEVNPLISTDLVFMDIVLQAVDGVVFFTFLE